MAAARSTTLTERYAEEFSLTVCQVRIVWRIGHAREGEKIFLVICRLDAFNSTVEYDSHLD